MKKASVFRHEELKAFTLIELMVCIAIVSVLIGLTVGGLAKTRQTAHMRLCGINLQQLYTGTMSYVNENKELFPYANDVASIPSGYKEPYWALRSYFNDVFPQASQGSIKSMKPYLCPSDRQTNGFSYLYAPYDLMANWDSVDPQYAVSKVLMNTPLEPLFLDSEPRHKIGNEESLLVHCDGSIVIREGKRQSPF